MRNTFSTQTVHEKCKHVPRFYSNCDTPGNVASFYRNFELCEFRRPWWGLLFIQLCTWPMSSGNVLRYSGTPERTPEHYKSSMWYVALIDWYQKFSPNYLAMLSHFPSFKKTTLLFSFFFQADYKSFGIICIDFYIFSLPLLFPSLFK